MIHPTKSTKADILKELDEQKKETVALRREIKSLKDDGRRLNATLEKQLDRAARDRAGHDVARQQMKDRMQELRDGHEQLRKKLVEVRIAARTTLALRFPQEIIELQRCAPEQDKLKRYEANEELNFIRLIELVVSNV